MGGWGRESCGESVRGDGCMCYLNMVIISQVYVCAKTSQMSVLYSVAQSCLQFTTVNYI